MVGVLTGSQAKDDEGATPIELNDLNTSPGPAEHTVKQVISKIRVDPGNIVVVADPFGFYDTAVTASFMVGSSNVQTQFMGGFETGVQALANYPSIDRGAFYASNGARGPAFTLKGGLIRPRRIDFLLPLTKKQIDYLRPRMFLTTNNHVGSSPLDFWETYVTSVDPGGRYIDVVGWVVAGGHNPVSGQVPSGPLKAGTGSDQKIYVNPATNSFGGNIVVSLDNQEASAISAVGLEVDVLNATGSYDHGTGVPSTIGYFANSFGSGQGERGYACGSSSTGRWHACFDVTSPADTAFRNSVQSTTGITLESWQTRGLFLALSPSGPGSPFTFSVDAGGNLTSVGGLFLTGTAQIELGSPTEVATPYIDFHSGGRNVDFDARLIASGGDNVPGEGTLTVAAAKLSVPMVQYGSTISKNLSKQCAAGETIFVSDARNPGERAGLGTGSLAFCNSLHVWFANGAPVRR